MTELLADNFTCAQGDRFFIIAWLSCFLLFDFAGTKPMTRFEGPSASGKTTAAKLITTLIYGEPNQKIATLARTTPTVRRTRSWRWTTSRSSR